MNLRSGHDQMALREADHLKTALWGAQRILWDFGMWSFLLGLENAPAYFQSQIDINFVNLPFARWYINDIVTWSRNSEDDRCGFQQSLVDEEIMVSKFHPGKCVFAVKKNNFLGRYVSAKGLICQLCRMCTLLQIHQVYSANLGHSDSIGNLCEDSVSSL